nr:alpha/beta hydrolase [Corynebacterium lactis]
MVASRRRPLALRIPASRAVPALRNSTSPADPVPVVLLHGTLDSPGAWAPLADALRAAGRTVYVPAFGNRGTGAVAQSVAEVEAYVREIVTGPAGSCGQVDIVGHSQGGLIAYVLALRGLPLRRVISVSGSVGGAPLPRLLAPLAWANGWLARVLIGDGAADQVALARRGALPGVPELGEVGQAGESPAGAKPQVAEWINVVSSHDRTVVPWPEWARRRFPAARTITLEERLGRSRGVPHWAQQTDAGVVSLLVELLTS